MSETINIYDTIIIFNTSDISYSHIIRDTTQLFQTPFNISDTMNSPDTSPHLFQTPFNISNTRNIPDTTPQFFQRPLISPTPGKFLTPEYSWVQKLFWEKGHAERDPTNEWYKLLRNFFFAMPGTRTVFLIERNTKNFLKTFNKPRDPGCFPHRKNLKKGA